MAEKPRLLVIDRDSAHGKSTLDCLAGSFELVTARTISKALSLLREHLWPDAAYMRATSAPAGWLPLAYARRAALGIRKWAVRSG